MRIALAVNGQKYRKEEDRYRITHKNELISQNYARKKLYFITLYLL